MLKTVPELRVFLKGREFPSISNQTYNKQFKLQYCTGPDGLQAITTYENNYQKKSAYDNILERTANFSQEEVNVSLSRYKYQSSLYKKQYDIKLSQPKQQSRQFTQSSLDRSKFPLKIIPLPLLSNSLISYVAFSAKDMDFK
ncbi:hypothetical protein SS50377_28176 [Spironucleus salmonicida]|uniref:Uncharacterized protein n=1 Tax=Spironucleus salmonicida TaxID=348837 RepID=V6LP48_9EUKA|nr:hypothetical protein SS50377_28176 [Spironucleus salmonicida]|eukprot:EST46380.1 Hypothetical protein SS50377_13623 [Spironucleus salmonicida]